MNDAQQRLFIAAELPEGLQGELAALQQRLRRAHPPVRWVNPDAMHLTLWFLGDVSVSHIASLKALLAETFAASHPAAVQLGHVGAFPNLQRPTVVWAGLTAGVAEVRQWNAALVHPLTAQGFVADTRPFQPHLTLGRVRRDATLDQQTRLGETIRQCQVHSSGEWLLRRITLFQSELSPEGSRYTALATVEL